MNNSNQTGVLIIMAIVLCAIGSFFAFFGSEMENQNLSSSYGQLSPSSSKKLFSNNTLFVEDYANKGNRGDVYGTKLNEYTAKSTASGDNSTQSSNPNFPSTGIEQTNVGSMSQTSSSKTAYSGGVKSNAYAISNTNFQNISDPAKSTINGSFLLNTGDAKAVGIHTTVKRTNQALAANSSTNMSGTKTVQKADGNPGEPGGGSLPVGDGVWIMLSMLGIYCLFITCSKFDLVNIIGLIR